MKAGSFGLFLLRGLFFFSLTSSFANIILCLSPFSEWGWRVGLLPVLNEDVVLIQNKLSHSQKKSSAGESNSKHPPTFKVKKMQEHCAQSQWPASDCHNYCMPLLGDPERAQHLVGIWEDARGFHMVYLCLRRSNSKLIWLAWKHNWAKMQNFLRKLKGLNGLEWKLFQS